MNEKTCPDNLRPIVGLEGPGYIPSPDELQCPPECPGPKLVRVTLLGITLPHLFDEKACGMPVDTNNVEQ